jgi:hypothetical protein
MDRQDKENPARGRKRFLAALALFFLWVAVLGVLAVTTGRRPPVRSATLDGR